MYKILNKLAELLKSAGIGYRENKNYSIGRQFLIDGTKMDVVSFKPSLLSDFDFPEPEYVEVFGFDGNETERFYDAQSAFEFLVEQIKKSSEVVKYSITIVNGKQVLGIKNSYLKSLRSTDDTVDYLSTIFDFTNDEIRNMRQMHLKDLRTFIYAFKDRFARKVVIA